MVFLVFRDEMTTNQSCEPSYPHFGSFTTSHGWETQFIAPWLLILASQLWKSLNYSPFCQLMTSVLLEYIMVYHLLSGQIIKNHYPEWFGYIEIIPITTHDSSEFTVRSISFTQISKKNWAELFLFHVGLPTEDAWVSHIQVHQWIFFGLSQK